MSYWMLLQSLISRRQRLRIEALERRVLELEPRSHATMTLVVDLATLPVEPSTFAMVDTRKDRPS